MYPRAIYSYQELWAAKVTMGSNTQAQLLRCSVAPPTWVVIPCTESLSILMAGSDHHPHSCCHWSCSRHCGYEMWSCRWRMIDWRIQCKDSYQNSNFSEKSLCYRTLCHENRWFGPKRNISLIDLSKSYKMHPSELKLDNPDSTLSTINWETVHATPAVELHIIIIIMSHVPWGIIACHKANTSSILIVTMVLCGRLGRDHRVHS